MGRYQDVANLRQKILDMANQSPVSSLLVAEKLCITKDYAYRTLRKMERIGELGRQGKGHNVKFYGLKEKTASVVEMVSKAQSRRIETLMHMEEAKRKEDERLTVVKGSKTIHMGMNRSRPIPNQGGQGSANYGHIQSSFQMV